MSNLSEQLLLVLNKEQEIYDKVILLSNEKQNAIVNNEINVLNDVVKKEKTYSISLVKLEEIRTKVIDQMVKEYRLVEINVLSDLYPHMSDQEVRQIETVKQRLTNTVSILTEKNEFSRKLIEQSMDQIQFNLDLLTSVGDGVNYQDTASDMDVERRSIFDRKI